MFWLKIRRFLELKKLENMMKKEIFTGKQRFHPFKRHLYQNEKAENKSVVDGRFVVKSHQDE